MDVKGTYRHFKGNNYEVIGEAVDKTSEEYYIFYRQLYYPFGFWIRPIDMFLGYKQDGENNIQRFIRIADSQADGLINVDLHEIEIINSESGEIYKIIDQSNGKFIVKKTNI